MDLLDHELSRAQVAREAYIRWRMGDLPGVYCNLMPCTANAKTLWNAEAAIRAQLKNDLEFCAQPWRRVGPSCSAILDFSELDPTKRIEFGLEVSVPVGQTDVPKAGREDEVAAEIEAMRARSLERAAALQRLEAAHHARTDAPECDRTSRKDAALLIPPPGPSHANADLHRAVRMLLLCHSATERSVVGLHLYHNIDLAAVADRVNLTPPRALEVFSSLARRVAMAEIQHAADEKRRQLDKKGSR